MTTAAETLVFTENVCFTFVLFRIITRKSSFLDKLRFKAAPNWWYPVVVLAREISASG